MPLIRALLLILLLSAPLIALAAEPTPAAPDASSEAARLQRMKRLMERIFTNSTSIRTKYSPEPNAFLVESIRDVKPGKALDVGMGQGRNALYLARSGWDVTGFDMSPTGVKQALDAARKENLVIEGVVASDDQFNFGVEKWDLIILTYVDFRHLMDRIRRSLKPGGLVVVEYYHRDTRKYRPMNDSKGFGDNELLRLFSDFRILRYEDAAARPDWNFEGEEKHRVVKLLARKQDPSEPVACYHEGKTYGSGEEACLGNNRMKCSEAGWQRKGACK